MPSVVSCDLRINIPRFSPIPAIMKAKKKPLETVKDTDLGIDLQAQYETVEVAAPPER